jgi:hypothetical protein
MLGDMVASAEPYDSHRPVVTGVMAVNLVLAAVAAWLLVDQAAPQG